MKDSMHSKHLCVLLLAVFVSSSNGDRKSKFLEELLKLQAADDKGELSQAEAINEFDDDQDAGFDFDQLVPRFKPYGKDDNDKQSKTKAIEAFDEDQDDEDQDVSWDSEEVASLARLVKTEFVKQAARARGRGDDKMTQKLEHILHSLFEMLDADSSNDVSPEELMAGCFDVFALLDYRGSQNSPRQLCGMAAVACANSSSDPLHHLAGKDRLAKVGFELQDENGDGKITAEEQANTQFAASVYLNRDYRLHGKPSPKAMCEAVADSATPATFEDRFRIMDANKNGVVSAKDYKAYVSAYYVIIK